MDSVQGLNKEQRTYNQINVNTIVLSALGVPFYCSLQNQDLSLQKIIEYEKFVLKGAGDYVADLEERASLIEGCTGSAFEYALHEKNLNYFSFLDKNYKNQIKELFDNDNADGVITIISQIKKDINTAVKFKDKKIIAKKKELLFQAKQTYLANLCQSRSAFTYLGESLVNAAEYLGTTDIIVVEGLVPDAKSIAAQGLGDTAFSLFYVEGLDKDITDKVNEKLLEKGMDDPLRSYELIIKTLLEREKLSEEELRKESKEIFKSIKKTLKDHQAVTEKLGDDFDPGSI